MKHSTLPWKTERRQTRGEFVTTTHIVAADGDHIAVVSPCEIEANTAFIVRACNAHYDLVKLLETILRAHDMGGNGASMYEATLCPALAVAIRHEIARVKE